MASMNDLTGLRFGSLTVLSVAYKKHTSYYWICVCDCGIKRVVRGSSMVCGDSAGCLQCGAKKRSVLLSTHGMTNTRVYGIWTDMRRRCRSTNRGDSSRYSLRGIKVCKRWSKFENFYKDMGEPPENHSLERIHNDKGYSPSNCKWATQYEQDRNKSTNLYLEFRGHRMIISDWARFTGLGKSTLIMRLWKYKMSVEDALTRPTKRGVIPKPIPHLT